MTKDLNRQFLKEDTGITNKHMKRYSISLTMKEMQIKPQWDNTSYPPELIKWKRLTTPNVEDDVEQLEL